MPAERPPVLLEVRDLRMQLGAQETPVRAVDGLSFKIRRGETFALLGESGCGKSMTAFSIMRLLPPSGRIVGGSVVFEGDELLGLSERQMQDYRGGRIGMIFQEPMTSLNPVMAVGAQIDEALRLHTELDRSERKLRVVELLDSVGIPDAKGRAGAYPHQLSGGMKQRVMIAIALAAEPELLIADEPTTAVDVTMQAQLLELLRDLQKERGLAILLITHDLGVVWEMADEIAVMYAGQLVETAPRERFFRDPQHPYSQKLFRALPDGRKRGSELEAIGGTVPPLSTEFTGCRFAARCHVALEHCSSAPPAWFGEDVEAQVRCHLYADGAPGKPSAPKPSPDDIAETAVVSNVQADHHLRVDDLKVHFPIQRGVFRRTVGYVRAVDGVSFEIGAGKTIALVGESGCGKTTVGKGILRLLEPTAGAVYFNGDDIAQLDRRALRARRSDFQIIFQDPFSSMNPRMRVGDIIIEGMQAQKIGANRADRLSRAKALLTQVGMNASALLRYPHEFSGGQRQRICIARALAVEPQLIVCDEPTSALDVSVQAQVLNLLKTLQRERGLSYLFITHDLSVVGYLADEVMVMYLGRIVERGTVQQVMQKPRHPYTQALLSAVPVVLQDRESKRVKLEGDLPSPSAPPQGCHFHPRCPRADAQCLSHYPQARDLGDGHTVHCHHAD